VMFSDVNSRHAILFLSAMRYPTQSYEHRSDSGDGSTIHTYVAGALDGVRNVIPGKGEY
jgi:hypothetical protein